MRGRAPRATAARPRTAAALATEPSPAEPGPVSALSRRACLRAGLRAGAAAAVGAPLLTACAAYRDLAAAVRSVRPADLTVYLVGGAPNIATPSGVYIPPGYLQGLVRPFQAALATARRSVAGLGRVTFESHNLTSQWFPPLNIMVGANTSEAARADDPLMPMPDVVVAESELFPDWLAARALDLNTDLLRLPQDFPKGLLRLGQCYAYGRGTFQAGLPLLRIPLLCLVPPGVSAAQAGKPWTADAFESTLHALSRGYPSPGAALPWVPYGVGVPEMAAVGSGGVLAKSSGNAVQATFADGAVGQAVVRVAQWAKYASTTPAWSAWPPVPTPAAAGTRKAVPTYGMLMFDGAAVLSGHGPLRGDADIAFSRAGWVAAPPPAFPVRPAVPVRTIQVMVSRHTRAAAQAVALAAALLSAEAQQSLLTFDGGLALRPAQALRQLAFIAPRAQGPDIIASSASDILWEDAWGARTDANSVPRALAHRDLLRTLSSAVGNGGYFLNFLRDFNGPAPEPRDYYTVPSGFVMPGPSGTLALLQAGQAAASAGRSYNPPY